MLRWCARVCAAVRNLCEYARAGRVPPTSSLPPSSFPSLHRLSPPLHTPTTPHAAPMSSSGASGCCSSSSRVAATPPSTSLHLVSSTCGKHTQGRRVLAWVLVLRGVGGKRAAADSERMMVVGILSRLRSRSRLPAPTPQPGGPGATHRLTPLAAASATAAAALRTLCPLPSALSSSCTSSTPCSSDGGRGGGEEEVGDEEEAGDEAQRGSAAQCRRGGAAAPSCPNMGAYRLLDTPTAHGAASASSLSRPQPTHPPTATASLAPVHPGRRPVSPTSPAEPATGPEPARPRGVDSPGVGGRGRAGE